MEEVTQGELDSWMWRRRLFGWEEELIMESWNCLINLVLEEDMNDT